MSTATTPAVMTRMTLTEFSLLICFHSLTVDFKKINSSDSSTFVLILTPDTFRAMTDPATQSSSKISVAQKLDKALEFKDIGNSFYKEGNFKNAARNYHRAILYLKVR